GVEEYRDPRPRVADHHAVPELAVHDASLQRERMRGRLRGAFRQAGRAIVAVPAVLELLPEVREQISAPAVTRLGVDAHAIEPLEQTAPPLLVTRLHRLVRVAEIGVLDELQPIAAGLPVHESLVLELG